MIYKLFPLSKIEAVFIILLCTSPSWCFVLNRKMVAEENIFLPSLAA